MAYAPNTYTTNGTDRDYNITFPFLRESDIRVTVFDASGNLLTDAADYDFSIQKPDATFQVRVVQNGTINNNDGGTALASGSTVTISRVTDISTLVTVFQDGASLRASDINALISQINFALEEFGDNTTSALGKNITQTAWDANSLRITNLAQPTADNDAVRKVDVDSGIGSAVTTVAGIASDVTTLSSGTDASGRLHRLNIEDVADDLNLGANSDITTVATDIRTGGNNHVQAVSNNIADVNTLAGNDTDGTAHLVNIETVAEDLAGSNTIGSVAGSIANVNTLAGSDAGGTAHLTNISDLAPQVSNISTLTQTANLTALQNAATNAAVAQAALTAFNRTYLGAYSSDPTVDGNGDALTDGDLYYNTTDEVLKFYNDTDDVWVTLSNSVQVNAATTLGAVGDANFGTLLEHDFIVRDGSNPAKWVNKTPAQARQSLGLGTAAVAATGDFATAAQGGLADTAVQPADLATVATSGSYNNLTNLPTLGTAAAAATGDFATATQGGTADTALQPNASADFGSNRIFYSNMWDTSSESLPSASTYHGMFLHDHHTGLGYFAHAGNWQALQNEITTSTALAAASLTTVTDAGNTVDVRRADRIAQNSSTNVDGGATLYDVTATATLTLSDLEAGDIVTVFSRSGTTTVARGTIAALYIDGDIGSNKTSVTVGGGSLATVTMVSGNTAIIAGSDLT